MAGNSTDPGRSVTSKVTAILAAFADGAVLTLTEIAGIAKLPTSTAHRLASELLAWRLLERTDEGAYRIGLPLRIIGKDATDHDLLTRAVLVVRARPVLAELANAIRTETRLGVLQGDKVIYLGHSGHGPTNVAALTLVVSSTLGSPLIKAAAFSYGVRKTVQGRRDADAVRSARRKHRADRRGER